MALLYADENFDRNTVIELRRLGHDVRTVQEAGRQGRDDPTVLADATAEGRAVVTFNRRDFIRLHRQSANQQGFIVCTDDPDSAALAARIDRAISGAGALSGRCLRVNRPP
jgi:predicted nuclease of predicted toxin-antitoxin system